VVSLSNHDLRTRVLRQAQGERRSKLVARIAASFFGAGALGVAVVLMVAAIACRAPEERTLPAAAARPAPTGGPGTSAVPHGDHNPHHGGIVMMKGDLHYEVVVDASGRAHEVFFTDAVRDDLPASIASSATLTIRRPGAPDEVVPLHIDDAGERWIGSGHEVRDRAKTTVGVAVTIHGEPYSIDLPLERKQ